MYWLYIVVVVSIIILVTIFILPWITQKLLFFPNNRTPFESLDNEYTISHGINLLFYDNGSNTPIVLYSHGNAGNIFDRRYLSSYFESINVSLLLYDYRGFGRSAGETTTTNIIEDGEHIYNYIKNVYPDREVILWGESMGSAVSWYLASKYDVKGLIITSGYASLADVINNVTVFGLGRLLSYLMFLPDNTLPAAQIKCPVLILHAEDDPLIPITHATKMMDVVNEVNPNNVTLVRSHGGHNFDFSEHSNDITKFIRSTNKTQKDL